MSAPLTPEQVQAVQVRIYQDAVAAVEKQLGEALPRFRGVEFVLAGYQMPKDLGQGPFYRRYPDLGARPWWDRSAWSPDVQRVLARFEDESPALREELEANVPKVRDDFASQVTGYFGAVDQWLSYPLVTEAGEPVPAAFAAFPRLADILAACVALRLSCKTYFALMRDGVHLKPHCGGQNVALRMHLGLRIPPGDAALRVGAEARSWTNGKTLFFDDTFVHEAWNRTGQDRYILLMRILHPDLSPIERTAHFLIEQEFIGSEAYQALKRQILVDKEQAKVAPAAPAPAAAPPAAQPPGGAWATVKPTFGISFKGPSASLPLPTWSTGSGTRGGTEK